MKYKLIKEYPNCPIKVGTIVLKGNEIDPNPHMYGTEDNECFFTRVEVEDYPEFWEKIEELCVPIGTTFINYGKLYIIKDVIEEDIVVLHEVGENSKGKPKAVYTINAVNKSFKGGTSQIVTLPIVEEFPIGTKVVDTFPETEGCTYEKLSNSKWRIGGLDYFTIEDSEIGENKRFRVLKEDEQDWYQLTTNNGHVQVRYDKEGNPTRRWNDNDLLPYTLNIKDTLPYSDDIESINLKTLTSFKLGDKTQNGVITYLSLRNEYKTAIYKTKEGGNTEYKLIEAELLKPLFQTEDGEYVYNGQRYWIVDKTTFIIEPKRVKMLDYDKYFNFSTKEAAENWVLLNKPCLSIKDVQSIYTSAKEGWRKNGNGEFYFEKLVSIVKSKTSK